VTVRYAAALSQNLKDQPMEVEMLGRKVVLFRDAETGGPGNQGARGGWLGVGSPVVALYIQGLRRIVMQQ
jgi:hypothetical protein